MISGCFSFYSMTYQLKSLSTLVPVCFIQCVYACECNVWTLVLETWRGNPEMSSHNIYAANLALLHNSGVRAYVLHSFAKAQNNIPLFITSASLLFH